MAKKSQPPENQFIATLEVERMKLAQEIAALTKRIEQIDVLRATYSSSHPKPMDQARSGAKQPIAHSPRIELKGGPGPFRGLGFPEACSRQLQIAGEPQTVRQIWSALHEGGFVTMAGSPLNATGHALWKRAKNSRDVIAIGKGKWARVEWYTGEQIKQLKEAKHHAKTMEGIKNARDRGMPWGRPRKITAENIAKFRQYRAEGMTAKTAAEAAGMSIAYYYSEKTAIDAWEPGDPWPPEERADGQQSPRVRLVK